MRTVVSGGALTDGAATDAALRGDRVAEALGGFDGVTLDGPAQEAIMAALEACASPRATDAALSQGGEEAADAAEDDPAQPFVRVPCDGTPYRGELLPGEVEDFEPFDSAEPHRSDHGADLPDWATPRVPAIAEVKKKRGRRAPLIAPAE